MIIWLLKLLLIWLLLSGFGCVICMIFGWDIPDWVLGITVTGAFTILIWMIVIA